MGIRRTAIGLAAILIAGSIAQAADADDLQEIDCGSSAFEFSDQAYDVSCERVDTQTHVGSSSGSVRLDVITISSRDRCG